MSFKHIATTLFLICRSSFFVSFSGKFYIVGGAIRGDIVEEAESTFFVVDPRNMQNVNLTDSVEIYNALQNKWVVGPTFPKKIYRPIVFSLQGDGGKSCFACATLERLFYTDLSGRVFNGLRHPFT